MSMRDVPPAPRQLRMPPPPTNQGDRYTDPFAQVEQELHDVLRATPPERTLPGRGQRAQIQMRRAEEEEEDVVLQLAHLVNRLSVHKLRGVCRDVCALPGYNKDQWAKPSELLELFADWAHDHLHPPVGPVVRATSHVVEAPASEEPKDESGGAA